MLLDPNITVESISPVNDQMDFLKFKRNNASALMKPRANPVMMSFVTAQARLKLLKHLNAHPDIFFIHGYGLDFHFARTWRTKN